MKRFYFALLPILFAACAFAETFQVNPKLSSLTFDVSAQVHHVHGVSNAFSGTITGDPADVTSAKIEVHLNPQTFDTDNDSRDKVMREKCLEIAKNPTIDFVSSAIESTTSQLASGQTIDATIQGKLKLHGLEKEMKVPVKITLNGDQLTAEGDMALLLDDWKIYRPRVVFFKLQNDIKIHFKIGATK